MFLVLTICFLAAFFALYQAKYRHRNYLLSRFPSPRKYPIVHNALEFIGVTPLEAFEKVERYKMEFGPVFQLTFEPFDCGTFFIADVKTAEEILTSNKIIDKGEDYDLLKPWLGTGLLIAKGSKWHQRRKILTPAFHFQILEKFVDIMDEQGKILVEKLSNCDGKEIDIFPLVNLYALDVICESAMGCRINAQLEDSKYTKNVKQITNILVNKLFNFHLQFKLIYRLTKMYHDEQKVTKELHDFTDSMIKTRRQELIEMSTNGETVDDLGKKKKMALLDLLLQATIDGKPLSNEDIREEVDTFMFEGHDTTTSGISFCLYNIAKYPEIQEKIFEEIKENVDRGEALTLQKINQLRYLELVVKESLRLYPSVPYFARFLTEDVEAAGYTFPKGCSINLSPYLMGRDPKIFPEPLKFRPERFDVETTYEKVNPFSYVPFSAGPRNCIGQKFAMFEMKSVITKIMQNFKISTNIQHLKLQSELILKTPNGVVLKIEKRE